MGMSFQKKRIPGAAAPDPATLEEDHARKGSTTLLDCHTTQDSLPIAETPNDNSIETVQADISSLTESPIENTTDNIHLLPTGLYDDITAQIDFYCQEHNITDRYKIHPLQWQGICYRVGESIKHRKILHDIAKEKTHGGTVYDGEKMAALLDLYGVICSDFRQVAFTFNFARFAGVSLDYLHDYMKKGLTSARVGLREKALNLQKASLVSTVNGGGSATVGNIFLSKALAGLQETSTVVHVSSAPAPVMDSVPDLARLGDGSGE